MQKLVGIIGTTGVGKSDFAVQLAKKINGEIINCDTMQCYKGLDIATNKISKNDQQNVKHNLLSIIDPTTTNEFSIKDFVKAATHEIDRILLEKKVPILVGGTHYYIQALLWDQSLIESAETVVDIETREVAHESIHLELKDKLARFFYKDVQKDLLEESLANKIKRSKDMYSVLETVDPEMAQKWHPHDDRKIRRSLEVYYSTGKLHSELIKIQQAKLNNDNDNLSTKNNGLRYKSLIFWLYADTLTLDPRLDGRVDKMLENGLVQELTDMRNRLQSTPDFRFDYTRGILQSIGFKEFHDYFQHIDENPITNNAFLSQNEISKIKNQQQVYFDTGIEQVKLATRQYSRKQLRWIRNKFFAKVLNTNEKIQAVQGLDDCENENIISFYVIDSCDIEKWNLNVKETGIAIANQFLKINDIDSKMPNPADISPFYNELKILIAKPQQWVRRTCHICVKRKKQKRKGQESDEEDEIGKNKIFYGDKEWDIHQNSRYHKLMVKRLSSK